MSIEFVYQEAKRMMLEGELDLTAHAIKAMICMTDTTCDTENDGIDALADFTDKDEFDGAGYTAGGPTLAGKSVTEVGGGVPDLVYFDAADNTITSVSAGTRMIAGLLIYGSTSNKPIAWLGFDSNLDPDGSDVTMQFSPTGLLGVLWPTGEGING